MAVPNPPAYLDFGPEQAPGQQLDYIRANYSTPDPDRVLDRFFPHLNEATMARFMEDCTAACEKIYQRLQTGPLAERLVNGLALLKEAEYVGCILPLEEAT